MFYAVTIGSRVQEFLPIISFNDSNKTKARMLHRNVLVMTKNFLFADETDFAI